MLFLIVFSFVFFTGIQSTLLKCDFESPCADFSLDSYWGLTDGKHPHPIDHDHTFKNSSGQYIFYIPSNSTRVPLAEIQTTNWLSVPTDRAVCFQMWYFTPRISLPFSVQVVQGDDEGLTRVLATIPGKNVSINDWTEVNVLLPPEKIKVFVRLNVSVGPLAFDDFSVDYCDGPRPPPADTIFTCDFESSCTENFVPFTEYFYQWSSIEASDAVRLVKQAPPIDYTFRNASGHYMWLRNSTDIQPGNVAYLATRSPMNFTSDQTFCLNFQYYIYTAYFSNVVLRIYSMVDNGTVVIQQLWPLRTSTMFEYKTNRWTWGIINLPVGYYSLLFRMSTKDTSSGAVALDNIEVTSCDYPPSSLTPYDSLLSFSCDFDNVTMCNMVNGDFNTPTFNFTLMTSATIPNPDLGPTYDHTTNSSSGGFLYWNQELPFRPRDFGVVRPSRPIEQNAGTCIRFAYYVKSAAVNRNATFISVGAGGCYGAAVWYQAMDDSNGWQVVKVSVPNYVCAETFDFTVNQQEPFAVAVAFDDIEIAQCSSFDPTTTTTVTSTTTTQFTITATKTTTTLASTSTTQITSTQSTTSTKTTFKSSTRTTQSHETTTNSANRLMFTFRAILVVLLLLLRCV